MSRANKGISRRIGFSSTKSKDILVAASKIIDNNTGNIGSLMLLSKRQNGQMRFLILTT